MADYSAALMTQLLDWVAERPRTYAEAMDAWKSSCPRHPVWDDALTEGLIEVVADGSPMSECVVRLTRRGSLLLALKPCDGVSGPS
jgi:hypothetical protein